MPYCPLSHLILKKLGKTDRMGILITTLILQVRCGRGKSVQLKAREGTEVGRGGPKVL